MSPLEGSIAINSSSQLGLPLANRAIRVKTLNANKQIYL